MDFQSVINKIMPYVQEGSDELFIIFRDKNNGWQYEFKQNQYSKTFDWVEDVLNKDPLAVMLKGSDLSNGSYSYVHDKIFLMRLHSEYMTTNYTNDHLDEGVQAILYCCDENMGEFSTDIATYLANLERPLTALYYMTALSVDLRSDDAKTNYDNSKVQAFVDRVEKKVSKYIKHNYGATATKIELDSYTELNRTEINNRLILLAENPKAEHRYAVIEYLLDSPLAPMDCQYYGVTGDFIEAIDEYTKIVRYNIRCIASERENRKVMQGIEPVSLTIADCLEGGLNENLVDKLIIIKTTALAPEFNTAEYQLKICTGGFGADPKSSGTTVFCTDLLSGKNSPFKRQDVLGVADIEKLPEWVKVKMNLKEVKPVKKSTLQEKLDNAKQKVAQDNIVRNSERCVSSINQKDQEVL